MDKQTDRQTDLSCDLHGLLVLLGEAGEHLGLEAPGERQEGQEAHDDQRQLPAEVKGDDDGHADVRHRVHDHANLRACRLGDAQHTCKLKR